jgi:hypothetical protein
MSRLEEKAARKRARVALKQSPQEIALRREHEIIGIVSKETARGKGKTRSSVAGKNEATSIR